MSKESDDKTLEPFAPRPGDQIGRYRLEESLGAGGMGEVFLADDTALNRKVAIKFLPAKSAVDPSARARFTREAQAAAKLNHPNIVHVYEVGEHRGYPYLAMEHIQGDSLKSVIRGGKLTLTDALDIARQLAAGLAEAHAGQVVHRDLKPGNVVMDHHGSPKLLDFGLATIDDQHELTRPGSTLGTVGYMSPEQVRGEPADERSDLFSLGVVLYEMITGRTPFARDAEPATLQAIVSDAPEPMGRYKAEVPDGVERIVARLLEKDPETRYQSAKDLAADLKREQRLLDDSRWVTTSHVTAPPPAPKKRRGRAAAMAAFLVVVLGALAVLRPWKSEVRPVATATAGENRLLVMHFQNLPDPEDSGRMGEIIADLVITDLSRSDNLQVVSNQRLFDILRQLGHTGRRAEPGLASRAAEKAGARWMLTGSILQSDPNFVITAQLVDVSSGNVASSERITGPEGATVFDAVDELTERLEAALAIPEAGGEAGDAELAEAMTHSTEAYRLYLEAVELRHKFLYEETVQKLEQVLRIDPEFLMAYYWMGDTQLAWGNYQRGMSYLEGAMARIDKGTEKQQLRVRARYAEAKGDDKQAVRYLKELLEIDPDDKEVLLNLSQISLISDDEGIGYLKHALELDPENKNALNQLAYAYAWTGRLEDALHQLDLYERVAPDEANPHDSRGDIYMMFGMLDEAEPCFKRAYEVNAGFVPSLQKLATIYMLRGDYAEARETYRRVADQGNAWEELGTLGLLNLEIWRGRFDRALAMLRESGALSEQERLWREAWLLICIEQYEPAIDVAQRAYDRALNDGARALAMDLKARALVALDRISEAEACLDVVRTDMPQGALEVDWVEAVLAEARGNYDRAESLYLGESQRKPGFFEAVVLGRLHLRAGEPERAVSVLELWKNVYERWRYDETCLGVLYHYHLGRAYEGVGRPADAVGEYRRFLELWGDADRELDTVRRARERLRALDA